MAPSFVASLGRGRRGDPASWRRMLNRVLCLIVTFVLATEMLTAFGALVGDASARQRAGLTLLITCQALLIVLHIVAARDGARRPLQLSVFALGVAGLVAAASVGWKGVQGLSAVTVDLLPTNAVQAIGLSAVVLIARRLVSLAIIVATGPLYLWLLSVGPREITWVTVDGWIMPTGMTVSTAFLAAYLRSRADHAEQLGIAARDARAASALATNAEQAMDEARRLVHDQVISALRTVESSDDLAVIQHTATTAMTSLRDVDQTASGLEFADTLACHRHPEVTVIDDGWPIAPPPKVHAALLDASREALRNAVRHGGVEQATVRLGATPRGEALVAILDDGVGFDPTARHGFGLQQSILARIHEVGGAVDIDSTPGRGSTVTLRWPALPASPGRMPAQIAGDNRGRFYALLVAPPAVVNIYLAARYANDQLLVNLAIAMVTAAVLLSTAFLVGRRPLRPAELVGIAAFNTAVTWASLMIASPGALMNLESWIVGFCADIIVVIGFEARARAVLALIAVEVATVVAFATRDPTINPFDPMGAIITPILIGGLGYLIGVLLRRGSRTLLIAEQVALAQAEEQGWMSSRAAARRVQLNHLEHDVEPFLHRFTTGLVPDAADRVRARLLMQQCVDGLSQTELMPPPFRAAAAAARARGVTVNVRPGSATEHRGLRIAEQLLYLEDAEVVTVMPGKVVVLPALSPANLAKIADANQAAVAAVHSDAVSTRFELHPTELASSLR